MLRTAARAAGVNEGGPGARLAPAHARDPAARDPSRGACAAGAAQSRRPCVVARPGPSRRGRLAGDGLPAGQAAGRPDRAVRRVPLDRRAGQPGLPALVGGIPQRPAGGPAEPAAGGAMLLAAPWVTRAATSVDRWLIRGLLGPGRLAQRVRDLEQSRALAVDDSAALLRRLERDLHDGAQIRLATLAMNLGMAREKLGDGAEVPDAAAVRELVDAALRGAKAALGDLRSLARGIHPPMLDNGLADALASLG